jgi:hypothetical protein
MDRQQKKCKIKSFHLCVLPKMAIHMYEELHLRHEYSRRHYNAQATVSYCMVKCHKRH